MYSQSVRLGVSYRVYRATFGDNLGWKRFVFQRDIVAHGTWLGFDLGNDLLRRNRRCPSSGRPHCQHPCGELGVGGLSKFTRCGIYPELSGHTTKFSRAVDEVSHLNTSSPASLLIFWGWGSPCGKRAPILRQAVGTGQYCYNCQGGVSVPDKDV